MAVRERVRKRATWLSRGAWGSYVRQVRCGAPRVRVAEWRHFRMPGSAVSLFVFPSSCCVVVVVRVHVDHPITPLGAGRVLASVGGYMGEIAGFAPSR